MKNLVGLWRESPRLRRQTMLFVMGQLSFTVLALVSEAPFIIRLLPATMGVYFYWNFFSECSRTFVLHRQLRELKERIRSRRDAYEEALAAGDEWLADVHRRAHNELVKEAKELCKRVLEGDDV